jgi:hypothetical protein
MEAGIRANLDTLHHILGETISYQSDLNIISFLFTIVPIITVNIKAHSSPLSKENLVSKHKIWLSTLLCNIVPIMKIGLKIVQNLFFMSG